ncbi:MAG: hypothetical protein O3C10_11275 [Chloroflexi bacterium]|nr:hypothetical protein [Chloroflexota bacterium]
MGVIVTNVDVLEGTSFAPPVVPYREFVTEAGDETLVLVGGGMAADIGFATTVIGYPTRVSQLQLRVETLEEEVSELKERLSAYEALDVVELRVISDVDARSEIELLFEGSSGLYYSEIADRLALELEQVVRICNQLEEEGVLGDDAKESDR